MNPTPTDYSGIYKATEGLQLVVSRITDESAAPACTSENCRERATHRVECGLSVAYCDACTLTMTRWPNAVAHALMRQWNQREA